MELYMHSSIAFQPSFGLSSIWAQSDPDPALPDLVAPFTGPLPEVTDGKCSQTAKKRQKVLFLAIFTDEDSFGESPVTQIVDHKNVEFPSVKKSYF